MSITVLKRKPSAFHAGDDHLDLPLPPRPFHHIVPAESWPPTKQALPSDSYKDFLNSNPCTNTIDSTRTVLRQKVAYFQNASRSVRPPPMPGASDTYTGTAKTCSILEKLINSGAVPDGAPVSYVGKRHKSVLKEGKITRHGILCSCCGHVFFLSKFEAHAGSSLHRPASNLFLADGRSLQDCQQQQQQQQQQATYTGNFTNIAQAARQPCTHPRPDDQTITTADHQTASASYECSQADLYAAPGDGSTNYSAGGDINSTCGWMEDLDAMYEQQQQQQEAGSNNTQDQAGQLFPLVADTTYSLIVDDSFLQGTYNQHDMSSYEASVNNTFNMQQDHQQKDYMMAQMEPQHAAQVVGIPPHVEQDVKSYGLQVQAEADTVCKNDYMPEKQLATMALLEEDHAVQDRPADYDGCVSREQGTSATQGRVDRAGALAEKGTHLSPAILDDMVMVSTTDDDDGHDDVCRICRDGGELIMCDGCPSSFHVQCVRLDSIPQGDWYCSECTCARCGSAAGKDPAQYCRRPQAVLQHNNTVHETRSDMISCPQCRLSFHRRCVDSGQYSVGNHFLYCSRTCLDVSTKLQSLVGCVHPLPGGLSWRLIRSFKEDTCQPSKLQVSFDKQLHKALKLLQQSFHPIKDSQTGIEMLAQTVFNRKSDVQTLDCSGFYTVLLCKGEQLVSAATVRTHGSEFAEVPFIATSYRFRHKGMCKAIMREVEGLLRGVGISELVIPAVNDLLSMWTGPAFNFKVLMTSLESEGNQLLKRMGGMSVMSFPGTTLLHKSLQNTSSQAIHDNEANCTGGVQLHQGSEAVSKAGGRHEQQLAQINGLNNETGELNFPFSHPAAGAAARAVDSRPKLQISRRALQVTTCY